MMMLMAMMMWRRRHIKRMAEKNAGKIKMFCQWAKRDGSQRSDKPKDNKTNIRCMHRN